MNDWRGVQATEIAEYMGFNLGTAFVALWTGNLPKALEYLERYDHQRAPLPKIDGHPFREIMAERRIIFNRPSPWCEPVRYAMAAICDMCSNPNIAEGSRLTLRAIQCVRTAIEDDKCMGKGLEP